MKTFGRTIETECTIFCIVCIDIHVIMTTVLYFVPLIRESMRNRYRRPSLLYIFRL